MKEDKGLANTLPLSVRMSRAAFDLVLYHRENVGILKGAFFGSTLAISILLLRQSPYALFGVGLLCAFALYQMHSVWKRSEYFHAYKKDIVAVADEYEMYLKYSNLGTIIKTMQAEIAGEAFVKARQLTDQEIGALVEAATRETKERPVALIKLNEAARLIDEALEQWIGRYPNHSLERMLETLEAIRTAEERRTMRFVIEDPKAKKET